MCPIGGRNSKADLDGSPGEGRASTDLRPFEVWILKTRAKERHRSRGGLVEGVFTHWLYSLLSWIGSHPAPIRIHHQGQAPMLKWLPIGHESTLRLCDTLTVFCMTPEVFRACFSCCCDATERHDRQCDISNRRACSTSTSPSVARANSWIDRLRWN